MAVRYSDHVADPGRQGPALSWNESRLAQGLLQLWPSYFALVLSFVMIGIYWANHHYVFKLFEKTDHGLNLLNLLLPPSAVESPK